jgi:hypothetical protein
MLGRAGRHRLGLVGAAVGVIAWCSGYGLAGTSASASVRSALAGTTATFTSAQVGTSGTTAGFSESGPWQMSWSYSCVHFGFPGLFMVTIERCQQ